MFYTDSDSFAGSERMVVKIIEKLTLENKYKLTFIHSKQMSDFYQNYENFKGEITKIPINYLVVDSHYPKKIRNYLKEVYNFIFGLVNAYKFRKINCDSLIFVNNGGYPGSSGALGFSIGSKIFTKSLLIMKINNSPIPRKSFKRKIEWVIDILVSRLVDIFIISANKNKEVLKSVLNIESKKIRVIPNSVEFPNVRAATDLERNKMNLTNQDIVIGIFGQLIERKGQRYFLEIMSEIEFRSDFKILIMGSGPDYNDIINQIRSPKLKNRVIVLHHNKSFIDVMNLVDIVCQPSYSHEDLPNTVNHALSLGKPVIANNIGGINEMVIDNFNGYLLEIDDNYRQNIESAINELILSKKKRKEFGENSKKLWLKNFSEDVVFPQYDKLIEENLC